MLLKRNGRRVGVVLEEALVVETEENLASRKRAKSGVALNRMGLELSGLAACQKHTVERRMLEERSVVGIVIIPRTFTERKWKIHPTSI